MIKPSANINKFFMWVIFLVSPLGTFIISLVNYKQKALKIFIYAFLLFYGYTFIPTPGSDGEVYMDEYKAAQQYSFDDYLTEIKEVFRERPGVLELYAPTLKMVSFAFAGSYHFYFMLAAMVYFFVYFKMLNSIWAFVNQKNIYNCLAFFLGCTIIYNLSAGINSIRFPLAFMVFTYGAVNVIVKKQSSYLLVASLSIFIHFAISFSLIFLIIGYATKFRMNKYLLLGLLIATYVSAFLFSSFLEPYLNVLGEAAESKYKGYTGEGYVETRGELVENWNWYVQFNLFSTYYFCLAILLLSRLKFFKLRFNETSDRLFFFAVIMLIHSVLSGSILEIVSNRYNQLFIIFALIYILHFASLNYNHRMIRIMNYIYIPILIVNILIKFRGDLYTVSPVLVFGNPFFALFGGEYDISIQEIILGK